MTTLLILMVKKNFRYNGTLISSMNDVRLAAIATLRVITLCHILPYGPYTVKGVVADIVSSISRFLVTDALTPPVLSSENYPHISFPLTLLLSW